jgi:CheY-like chemotaxis protein
LPLRGVHIPGVSGGYHLSFDVFTSSAQKSSPSKPRILVAEDDKDDQYLLRFAFNKTSIPYELFFVQDGFEAMNYLLGRPPFADRPANPMPGLILLDLKMPGTDGFDVLQWLLEHPEFSEIPVAVLSASDLDRDIQRAQQLGADSYYTKPFGISALIALFETLEHDWLTKGTIIRPAKSLWNEPFPERGALVERSEVHAA